MTTLSRILVIKLGAIGEFVLSLPAMQRIREAHPRASITLLTTPRFETLAKSSRWFNAVVTEGEPDGLGETMSLVGWMRRCRFDRVYDLENSSRTGFYFQALKPFAPEWSGSAAGASLRHRNPRRGAMHVLERNAEQLCDAGIWPDAPTAPGSAPPPDLSWILKLHPQPRPVAGAVKPRPYVLLAPGGSSQPDRRWPAENFAALAGRLSENYDVVVVGEPEESALARTIQRGARHVRDLTGRADFAQVAALGARASLAVGNDSGAIHLVAAAGAPTIALFSPASDADISGPRGYVAILRSERLCDLPVQQVAETARVLARSS